MQVKRTAWSTRMGRLGAMNHTICTGMRLGQVYNLYRNTCLFAGKSSMKACMSRRRAELPGPSPQARAPRTGTGASAPRTAVRETANEPVPAPNSAAAPIPEAAALAAAAAAATVTENVVTDPAAITLSRRMSQKLG